MKVKGIRICDKIERIVSVELQDILEEVENGNLFQWSILFFNGTGKLGNGKLITSFTEEINNSKNGFLVNWSELKDLAKCFYDVYDILLICCKDPKLILRYEKDQTMYETCDIVIEMFDSNFWEVFSNDEKFIKRLTDKFKDVKFLDSDFQK